MLSISNALKKQSVSGVAAPACKIKIKLKSGKELVLTQSDLWEGGFSMDDATSRAGSFDGPSDHKPLEAEFRRL